MLLANGLHDSSQEIARLVTVKCGPHPHFLSNPEELGRESTLKALGFARTEIGDDGTIGVKTKGTIEDNMVNFQDLVDQLSDIVLGDSERLF